MELSDRELADLYDRYAPVLFVRCRTLLRNDEDAQDAVHETFARVIRNARGFREQSSPLTWMYKISTNYCLNQLRNGKGRREKLHHHKTEITGMDAPPAESFEDHDRVLNLLDTFDEQTRQCVIYTYFDDCTRQETADLVGISVPTVRKRIQTFLTRARRTLVAAVAALFVLSTALPGGPL
jgi:RNA polymerase sigma-70 factor (ECF subfamily)